MTGGLFSSPFYSLSTHKLEGPHGPPAASRSATDGVPQNDRCHGKRRAHASGDNPALLALGCSLQGQVQIYASLTSRRRAHTFLSISRRLCESLSWVFQKAGLSVVGQSGDCDLTAKEIAATRCDVLLVNPARAVNKAKTMELLPETIGLSGRDLFVVRLKLLFGVRRRGCRRALCFFCAFGGFSLLTPFRFRPLLFLALEFLLTLLEGDAHGSPQKSGCIYVH